MSVAARPLDGERLRELLRGEAGISQLIVRDGVGSTNDELRALATRGATTGTVLLAESQHAGRGRLGRRWHSAPGLGLYLSLLLRPAAPVARLTRWTLAAGVAACEACRQIGEVHASILWPNDLVWRGRKLGGVLAETLQTRDAVSLVLGIGLNVAHEAADFPIELRDKAASLRSAGGATPDRELLAAVCLRELAELGRLLDRDRWSAVARRWEALAPGARGARVRVSDPSCPDGAYEGRSDGLEPDGALRVRGDGGRIGIVRMAESVRFLEDESCC